MFGSALLAFALLAHGSTPPERMGEEPPVVVHTVEIEAPESDRLHDLVDLVPGQPLDREAVRRAVRLMFATGRFEDVPVELVRDDEETGARVVFRPVPAPLLVDIRVEGDRVLSPRAVARAARLRPGDPLWPSRLERAGRDVGLALERDGRLEALVQARAVRVEGGADAVFRVRAGPRVRVRSTSLQTSVRREELAALIRPRRGAVYRREEAEAAAERMRQRLVDHERWRATVEVCPTYDPGRGVVDLVFVVAPGPVMSLGISGATLPRSQVSAVRDLLRDGRAETDALATGVERIEGYLREQGYRDAAARVSSQLHPGGLEAIVYDVQAGRQAIAASVKLRGVDPALLETLRTRAGRPIVDATLAEDERRLVSLLEERGHFDAHVETEVPEGGGRLAVTFVAQPGPRAVVKAVTNVGPPLPTSREGDAPRALAIRVGQPYRVADVARSRDTLLDVWRRAGYLEVRVHPEVVVSEARDEVRVRFVVEPGTRSLVDHVVLAGIGRTRASVIEREMALQPGEPYSFERVLESQRRLSSLGILERVSISALEYDEGMRDVVVSVQEAPQTTVWWGFGYSEEDQLQDRLLNRLRGSVELTRRNLNGSARSATLFARGSFRGSRLLATLREPWLFGRRLESSLSGFWEEENRKTFDYNRKGGTLQVGHTFDPRTSLVLRYLFQDTNVYGVREDVSIDEIDRQYRIYTVSGPSAALVFDTRDDPLEPKGGVFLGADLQLSLAALGGESYLRGYLRSASVHRLRPDLVFVVAARVGLARGLAAEARQLPLAERFFAGGDFGPRGHPVDGVGPQSLSSDDPQTPLPIGGNAVLFGGAELRYNLTRAFQLATFVDVGNVWDEVQHMALGAVRRSAGVGLRYRTPVGPVRLDWGYVLDQKPGEDRSRFHLTIGHAF